MVTSRRFSSPHAASKYLSRAVMALLPLFALTHCTKDEQPVEETITAENQDEAALPPADEEGPIDATLDDSMTNGVATEDPAAAAAALDDSMADEPEPLAAEEEATAPETVTTPTEGAVDTAEAEPLSVAATVVYFDFDEARLSKDAKVILDDLATRLQSSPKASLHVVGHADERGSHAYNLALGKERAESVRSYLAERGINADRITTESVGEDDPAVFGQTEESYRLNRRATFSILE